jgi:serine/threonine protein kinase
MAAPPVLARFRVEATIGQGGMGEVYRAWDTVLARHVALKWIRHDLRGETSTVARLQREARSAAGLRHPNVVVIYDLGLEADATYIVMELLDGRPLSAVVTDPSVTPAQKLSWLREIASALAAAHAASLVHRDVKPGNVMICRDGHAKVLDFGLAKRSGLAPVEVSPSLSSPGGAPSLSPPSFRTEEGVVLGTPRYMAPEQARGDEIDPRADQFSWAALGYELVHGERWSPLLRDRPAPPGPLAALTGILWRATEDVPAARFRSMNEVLAALDSAMGASPSPNASPPVPMTETRSTSMPSISPPAPSPPSAAPITAAQTGRNAMTILAVGAGTFVLGGIALGAYVFLAHGPAAPTASSSPPAATATPSASATSSAGPEPVTPPPSATSTPATSSRQLPSTSASRTPKPPSRVRYGAPLNESMFLSGVVVHCKDVDVEAFMTTIEKSRARFAPCFEQTIFEPPVHGSPIFEVALSADGKFGAASQWHPKPPHPALSACITRAMSDVPITKRGGGACHVRIDFNAYCKQPRDDGQNAPDHCADP